MSIIKYLCLLLNLYLAYHLTNADFISKESTVVIVILARNKAHTLPYFLTLLQNLNYPKERIGLWIRSDHNSDNTIEILQTWINSVEDQYHVIDYELNQNEDKFSDETGPAHWSLTRFSHVIDLRENGLNYAKNIWADYVLQLDCDVFLTNPNTLTELIEKNYPIVGPMVKSDSLYSNFWSGMTNGYYYQRTDDYKPILNREQKGCFSVPMVHSCVLIDLRLKQTDLLTYNPNNIENYDGPHDDIITLALSANRTNLPMHVCNENIYGYVTVPLEQTDYLYRDYQQVTNIKLEALADGEVPILANDVLSKFVKLPEKDKHGFAHIYMINLLRRPERRLRMQACFDQLGMDVEVIDAVDGKALNESTLSTIQLMPEYRDPHHGRGMTLGEVGCFLSHYEVWNRVLQANLASTDRVLVLEDDIRFEPYFLHKLRHLLNELDSVNWDLVYLGRKRLADQDEPAVEGTQLLVRPGYSYWTLGYALTVEGARKLISAKPLDNLLPVDEYLPILFGRHPNEEWTQHFPSQDVIALSAAPPILFPARYTGEPGYVSDTEDSDIINEVEESHLHDGDL